jgi:hypothetical protein
MQRGPSCIYSSSVTRRRPRRNRGPSFLQDRRSRARRSRERCRASPCASSSSSLRPYAGSISYRLAGAREGYHAARKSWEERTCFGSGEAFKDHANWLRRASRISTGERPAGRGVEPSFPGWFGSADGGGDRDMSGWLRRRRHGSRNTGTSAGAKPRAKRCGTSRTALRATTVPVRMNGGWGSGWSAGGLVRLI